MTVFERIRYLRTEVLNLTQAQFAEKLNLSRNYIVLLESGSRQPSERTLTDICNEFKVSESWLRAGDGDMFLPKTMEDALSELFDEVAGEREDSFRKQVFLGMARLDAKDWAVMAQLVRKMLGKDTAEK